MKNFEEKSSFDSDYLVENEYSDNENEIINDPLYFINNNNLIYFGFYEKTSNIFYKVEESKSKKFTINKKSKNLEIKYFSKYHSHTRILFYNLEDNIPYLIRNKKFNNNLPEDLIINFPFAPIHRKRKDNYNEPSDYFLENYNSENNLICFDCPYRTIYIPNCSKIDLNQIYNQILKNEKNEIIINEKINLLDFDDYKIKVMELKDKINNENKNDFNNIYNIYANIS